MQALRGTEAHACAGQPGASRCRLYCTNAGADRTALLRDRTAGVTAVADSTAVSDLPHENVSCRPWCLDATDAVAHVPISQIRFGHPSADTSEAQDVHVLRGQKTQVLRDRIWVHDATKNERRTLSDYETENHDVELEFAPVFKATPDATGKKLQGFGIFVDIKNGQVEAKAAPPGHAPSNFILEVFVTENGTGTAAPLIPNGTLRVHVHGSVKNVWLTPSKLSIRRSRTAGNEELTDSVFTVRAQFDDDTVVMVTDSDEVKFSPSEWFIAKWVRIPASAGNTVAPFTVKVTTSAKWNNKTANATVEIVRRWQDEPNVPTAELVDGHPDVWSGTRKPEEVPNVLFLGTGFTDADRESFAAITNLVVHNMRRETLLQPFGYLATSINYWRLMLPNVERGISVQCEVQQAMQNGLLFAWAIPSPAESPPTAADWQLQHLIYMAGLPVPADFNLVRTSRLPTSTHCVRTTTPRSTSRRCRTSGSRRCAWTSRCPWCTRSRPAA